MIIFVENERIFSYMLDEDFTEERKVEILTNNPYAVWTDEEFNYPNLNKAYDLYYQDGKIVYVEIEEPVEPEPTEQEILQAEILLNQAKILAKLNALEV